MEETIAREPVEERVMEPVWEQVSFAKQFEDHSPKAVSYTHLAKHPKVIILDEPTRGIDVGSKAEIYAIMDELAAAGTSIIMVSSELPEIINMCNRCYVMCEGKITGELAENEFCQEVMMKYATNREEAVG